MDTVTAETAPERHAYDGTTCRILIGRVLDLIANKWAVPIILALGRAKAPLRFTELARAIPTITQKELTKQLRELEAVGLVGRRVHAVVPPKVEYWLTETGFSLTPVLDTRAAWAATNGATLARHRTGRASNDDRAPSGVA
jgi:DNA-binding HxlR family transcriptional regulator